VHLFFTVKSPVRLITLPRTSGTRVSCYEGNISCRKPVFADASQSMLVRAHCFLQHVWDCSSIYQWCPPIVHSCFGTLVIGGICTNMESQHPHPFG